MAEENKKEFSEEEVKEVLVKSSNDRPAQSILNCGKALMLDPMLQGRIRLNVLSGHIDLTGEFPWRRNGSSMLTDTDLHEIECRLETKYELRSEKNIRKAIDIIANRNSYHPILEYLEGLVWDEKPRIRMLMKHFLGAPEDDYTEQVTLLLMRSALKRLYEPGCKYDSMICLIGDQGIGKSTFFRFLALKDEWFCDDLKRLEDDNVYRKLQGHWIIEMPEMLATANARSIEDIKAFLSRQKDTYKVPYDIYPQDFPRQCIFVGTTNNAQFLPFDRSGNRRFIPVMTDTSCMEAHILEDEAASRDYMRQAWAEMMVIYQAEESHPLTLPKEMHEEMRMFQEEYMPEDTKRGVLAAWLEEKAPGYVCSAMIRKEAFGEMANPRHWELREIGELMRTFPEWIPVTSHRFREYGIQRGWMRREDSLSDGRTG